MVNLHLSQKKIINKIKKYFKKLKTQKIDISKSSFCYFNTYSDSPGYALGNLWNKKINKIEFFSYILKNIYSIFFISNYEISNLSNYKYENIIVTWGRHKDFKKNVFKDSFSNILYLYNQT